MSGYDIRSELKWGNQIEMHRRISDQERDWEIQAARYWVGGPEEANSGRTGGKTDGRLAGGWRIWEEMYRDLQNYWSA